MSQLIFLLLIVLGFVSRKSKLVFWLILIYICILFGWNYDNPDFGGYQLQYENDEFGRVFFFSGEIGFDIMCMIGNHFHLSFQQFRILIAFIFYPLFFHIIKTHTKNVSLVASLYFSCFFILDVTQIRNFISFVIVLFAFSKYIKPEFRFRNAVLYSLFVILATTIHFTSFFFLLFLLVYRKVNWKLIIFLVAGAAVIRTGIYTFLYDNFGKLLTYNEGGMSLLSSISFSVVQVANCFFIKYMCNRHMKNNGYKDIIIAINIILLGILPFYWDGAIYTRLFRFTAIINILFLADGVFDSKSNRDKLFLCCYSVYFLVMFLLLSLDGFVIRCVFENNSFF